MDIFLEQTPDVDAICALITTNIHPDLPLVNARQFLNTLAEKYMPAVKNVEDKKRIIQYTMDQLNQRSVSFEEQITQLALCQAQLYEDEENWAKSASILMGIPLESGHRAVPAKQKVDIYLHIVRLLLEDENGDHVSAEAYLNRAATIIHEVEDPMLSLIFKVCQAKILNITRRFPEAAQKYHELSKTPNMDANEELHALSQAVICTVLSNSSPLKTKMLSILYNDERISAKCPPVLWQILEKVVTEKLLNAQIASAFQQLLSEHQMALLANGNTVFDRSVLEHNFLAISNLFSSISLQSLGNLLNINQLEAEKLAAKMFSSKRVVGIIDQSDSFVYFKKPAYSNSQSQLSLENLMKQVSSISETIAC